MRIIKGLVLGGLKFVAATAAGALVFGRITYVYCDWRIRNYDPNSNGFGEGFMVFFAILAGGMIGAFVGLGWAVWPYLTENPN